MREEQSASGYVPLAASKEKAEEDVIGNPTRRPRDGDTIGKLRA